MLVTVDTVNTPASPMDSIITASGLDEHGNRVTFGGDHRPMAGLAEMVEYEGEVACEVEPWQVLSSVPEPDPFEETARGKHDVPLFEVVGEQVVSGE